MELKKIRNGWGKIVITPMHKKDNPLFLHCTLGYLEYPNKGFNKILWPILQAHGVYSTHIIDKVKRK